MWPSCYTSSPQICRLLPVPYGRRLGRLVYGEPFSERLRKRALYGSDFPINLLDVDSCNHYLLQYANTEHLSETEKDRFCCANPESFQFHPS
jgi:hypothetical protein